MLIRNFPLFVINLLLLLASEKLYAQERKFKIVSIAFYNLENLFDTKDNPFTFDDDRTPEGDDVWTTPKYQEKLKHLARVISEIGIAEIQQPPVLIGICEVENREVVEDLIKQPDLQQYNYGIIHYDSPDRRGIDVALLYRKDFFFPKHSQSRELLIFNSNKSNKRVYTRDQLVVSGVLDGETIHLIVNHWPSRSGGQAASNYKREKAAALNRKIIDSIYQKEPLARVISMGDFNDDPTNSSFKKVLETKKSPKNLNLHQLFNPMEKMRKKGLGTLAYRDGWNLFDQIILSGGFTTKSYETFQYYKAGIFNKKYLINQNGKFKGYPFRSYGSSGYQGGYSDHFPVYVYLIKEVPSNSSYKEE